MMCVSLPDLQYWSKPTFLGCNELLKFKNTILFIRNLGTHCKHQRTPRKVSTAKDQGISYHVPNCVLKVLQLNRKFLKPFPLLSHLYWITQTEKTVKNIGCWKLFRNKESNGLDRDNR